MDQTGIIFNCCDFTDIFGVLIIGVRSMIRRATTGCCGAGDEIKPIYPEDRDLSHYPYCYRLRVEGISCQNCVNRIQNAFHKQNGLYARVNRHKKEAVVYAKQEQTQDVLEKVVTSLGYQVTGFTAVDQ